MRIADNMNFDQVQSNISSNRTQMSQLQNQAATQKRVTRPSDDPISASRVLTSRLDLQGSLQFLKNLNYARSFLDYTDQSLEEVSTHLMRAKELAISQANDASSNKQSRRAVATEIKQIHDQLVQVSNRKLGDRFIFGGYQTQLSPFDRDGNYKGDDGEMLIHVEKSGFIPMNVPGGRVFLGKGLTADGIVESTKPQPTSLAEIAEIQQDYVQSHTYNKTTTRNDEIRGPASAGMRTPAPIEENNDQANGTNLFKLLNRLEVALRTDDKGGVQDSLEQLDDALAQVVLTRSQVGSRGMTLNNAFETLQKAKVDNQTQISQMEDADAFQVISDISKTEGTLKATLETSGKLIQPSLLDYLR